MIFDKDNKKKIIEKLQYYNIYERVCKREIECVRNSFTFSGKKNPYDAFMLSRVKFNYFQSSFQSKGVFIYNNFCVRFDIQIRMYK